MYAPERPEHLASPENGANLMLLNEPTVSSIENSIQIGSAVARRNVSIDSQESLLGVIRQLKDVIIDDRHFLPARSLGVSVLGNYQFRGLHNFPSTEVVTETITSTAWPLSVRMARLAFFGKQLSEHCDAGDNIRVKGKLVIELDSPELKLEAANYEEEYARRGFLLSPLPGDGTYRPHITLAQLKAPRRYFKKPATIASLNRLAQLADRDAPIMLDPVSRRRD